jgi:hypothetical protein
MRPVVMPDIGASILAKLKQSEDFRRQLSTVFAAVLSGRIPAAIILLKRNLKLM